MLFCKNYIVGIQIDQLNLPVGACMNEWWTLKDMHHIVKYIQK